MKVKNAPTKPLPPSTKRRSLIIFSAIIIAIVMSVIALSLALFFKTNYAQDIALPFEKTLIGHGAIKKCAFGDGGRSIDNRQPWYESYFESSLNRERATELVKRAANDNMFNLTQAAPDNKGNIGVADFYLKNWLFDEGKQHQYADLEDGKIQLQIALYNDEKIELNHLSCGTKEPVTINNDSNNTAIKIHVSLPRYKQ